MDPSAIGRRPSRTSPLERWPVGCRSQAALERQQIGAIRFGFGSHRHCRARPLGRHRTYGFSHSVRGSSAWRDGGHVNVFAVAAFADWHPAVRQMVAAGRHRLHVHRHCIDGGAGLTPPTAGGRDTPRPLSLSATAWSMAATSWRRVATNPSRRERARPDMEQALREQPLADQRGAGAVRAIGCTGRPPFRSAALLASVGVGWTMARICH